MYKNSFPTQQKEILLPIS